MPISYPPIKPQQFQKAIIFIDGTNLFCRLVDHKMILNISLADIFSQFVGERQIVRIYLYTNRYKLDEAKEVHGNYITDGIRIVLGEGIPTQDGNIKEKGVDALLVADLVYHAAVKNYDYALLVSTDTDFVHALRRVEDFGCTTGVLGLCSELPERLNNAADQSKILTKEDLINNNWVKCKPISEGKRGAIEATPPGKTRIKIPLDDEILIWFREQVQQAGGGNYQTLINDALLEYIQQSREPLEATLRRVLREELERIGK